MGDELVKKWYIKLNSKNIIQDVISFPYGNYQEIELEDLPDGLAGGWFKYENGQVVEYPELKPIDENAKISALEALLSTASQKYDALDKKAASLSDLKEARIAKLKEECSAAIYEGFTSEEYQFGFKQQDQENFTQRMLTIIAGAAGPFEWKTKNAGVVSLTKEEFIAAINNAEAHKLTEQKKYWALEAQVLAAETNTEVDAVKW